MKYWYMFTGEITEKSIGEMIVDLFKQTNENPKTEFSLYISSTGGDVDSAVRFYDFVKASGILIDTVGFGQVDSAAILLFLCGKERTSIENCRFRVHSPAYRGYSEAQTINEHGEMTSLLKEIDERYFQILQYELKHLGNVRNIYNQGAIWDPQKCLEMGVATKIEKKLPLVHQHKQ